MDNNYQEYYSIISCCPKITMNEIRMLYQLRKSETYQNQILSIFEELLKKCDDESYIHFLRTAVQFENGQSILRNKIDKIIENTSPSNVELLINFLGDFKDHSTLIIEYFDDLLKRSDKFVGSFLLKCVISGEGLEYFKDKNYLLYLIMNGEISTARLASKQLGTVYNFLSDKTNMENIKALMKYLVGEEITRENISFLKGGTTSFVFKIKDYVLKLKLMIKDRNDNPYFNDPAILLPIISESIETSDPDINLAIEVFRYADTKGIKEGDAAKLSKELFDRGIYWSDVQDDNVGIVTDGDKSYLVVIDAEYMKPIPDHMKPIPNDTETEEIASRNL
jgi:hypothetical protein